MQKFNNRIQRKRARVYIMKKAFSSLKKDKLRYGTLLLLLSHSHLREYREILASYSCYILRLISRLVREKEEHEDKFIETLNFKVLDILIQIAKRIK